MSQESKSLAADLPTTKIGGRNDIDWLTIESDYRAGIKTLRAIAAEHGITEGAIRKRARRDDWARDLSAKIADKANELVRAQEVRAEYAKANERTIVEVNAQMQANIMLAHRRDVPIARDLVMALLAECKATTDSRELFEQLGELMRSPDEKGIDKLNDLYQKVVSLPGRVDSAKKLAEAIKTLVELERKVFKIEDAGQFDQDDQVVVIRREIVIN